MDIRRRIPVIATLATNAPAVTKNEIWPKRVFLSLEVLIWFNTQMVQPRTQKDAQVFEATSSHYIESRDAVYDESPFFVAQIADEKDEDYVGEQGR